MAEEVAFEADVRAGGSAGGTVVTGASDMQADADALARVVDDLGEAAERMFGCFPRPQMCLFFLPLHPGQTSAATGAATTQEVELL